MLSSLKITLALFAVLLGADAAIKGDDGPELKGWGRVVDPDGDCKVVEAKDGLLIEVPAKPHDHWKRAELGRLNAPRIIQAVEGDWIAEVRIVGDLKPAAPATVEARAPYQGAGLLLWQDEKNYACLKRAAIERDGQVVPYVNFELRANGEIAATHPAMANEEPLYVRLERRGARILGSVSVDGIRWIALEPIDHEFARAVKIGVVAVNTSSAPLKVQMDGYGVFVKDRKTEPLRR